MIVTSTYTEITIIPFHATDLFLQLLKTSETPGFQMFSGGIGRDQWHVTS